MMTDEQQTCQKFISPLKKTLHTQTYNQHIYNAKRIEPEVNKKFPNIPRLTGPKKTEKEMKQTSLNVDYHLNRLKINN